MRTDLPFPGSRADISTGTKAANPAKLSNARKKTEQITPVPPFWNRTGNKDLIRRNSFIFFLMSKSLRDDVDDTKWNSESFCGKCRDKQAHVSTGGPSSDDIYRQVFSGCPVFYFPETIMDGAWLSIFFLRVRYPVQKEELHPKAIPNNRP